MQLGADIVFRLYLAKDGVSEALNAINGAFQEDQIHIHKLRQTKFVFVRNAVQEVVLEQFVPAPPSQHFDMGVSTHAAKSNCSTTNLTTKNEGLQVVYLTLSEVSYQLTKRIGKQCVLRFTFLP